MTTLTEFLLARIAEDEARARTMTPVTADWATWGPERMLVECEIKRRVVQEHPNLNAYLDPEHWVCARCQDRYSHDAHRWPCPTLLILALPYGDHPDYDKLWRPA